MTEICSSCGSEGMKVLPLTLGAHVKEELWGEIDQSYYFCPSRSCEVVYFSNARQISFTAQEVRTRIGIKEDEEPRPLCYCSRVTQGMLEKAILERNCCSTLEEVREATGAGKGKWCLTTNPSGRCCEWYLEDIIAGYLRLAEPKVTPERRSRGEELERLGIKVSGMTCEGCASVVKGTLEANGASKVRVSFKEGKADMLVPGGEAEKFVRAVKEAGYGAKIASGGEWE